MLLNNQLKNLSFFFAVQKKNVEPLTTDRSLDSEGYIQHDASYSLFCWQHPFFS